ncbi:MAG: alkaline phosphatase family protein [Lentisphaerae bacterium]|nr:alkaline phosphatase family protein [Lentisphaerota bacterium]
MAYIGPGAGFAVLGSFLMVALTLALALLSLLTLPARLLILGIRRSRRARRASARRVIVLGLDALDPGFARQLMDRGELPNLARLAAMGSFTDLRTTCPPISPVAWSTFMTGVNPGKHNIFDFLNRDPRTYAIELSSGRVEERRGRLGRRIATFSAGRKSMPFWKLLGEAGVPSTILRVPLSFPPEPFAGRLLAGMCVPDLRGTQGEFTVFEEAGAAPAGALTSGMRVTITLHHGRARTAMPGPRLDDRRLSCPLDLHVDAARGTATLRVAGERVHLTPGHYSDWVNIPFRHGRRRVHGICRFLLLATAPHVRLYATPLNINPERPALPIAHPGHYAVYLAKLHGPFATLGIAEDTWALNEGVISEDDYLRQVYDIHAEREAMFFDAVRRTRFGVCTCVFDTPDRVQHVFWRDPDIRQPPPDGRPPRWRDVMVDLYRRMDALVGRTLAELDDDTVLLVLSDHGFGAFRRAVNLNAWLHANGYLALLPGAPAADYFQDVDWAHTRAYALGLGGIYLNQAGREGQGTVMPGPERDALKREIAERLKALRDPQADAPPVHAVYDAEATYVGPYVENAPDLLVGFANGWRASWENAVGRTAGDIFADNTKHWQADHIIDHTLVPGVLFSNRPLTPAPGRRPHIADIAPTVLRLFGIDKPDHMDGESLEAGRPRPNASPPAAAP